MDDSPALHDAWPISPTLTRFPWHPQRSRWRYFFATSALVMAVGVWVFTRGGQNIDVRVFTAIFALIASPLLIEQETWVDSRARTVAREGRLFGRFRVWRQIHPLNEFTAIALKRQPDAEGGETMFVGLVRRNGRLMNIRYFSASPGHPSVEAEQVARSLADRTGLPLPEGVP